MLARDWYYNERRQIGLDSAVASIYDRDDDRDIRARAALTMLGVERGWRVADIGCGNGVMGRGAGAKGSTQSIFRRRCWRWGKFRPATARSRSGPSRPAY